MQGCRSGKPCRFERPTKGFETPAQGCLVQVLAIEAA